MSGKKHPPRGPGPSVGAEAPSIKCPDCDGEQFELNVDADGKPTVMIFTGGRPLSEIGKDTLDKPTFGYGRMQIATFVPAGPDIAKADKEAADWPHRTVPDPAGEIADDFEALSGVPAPAVYVVGGDGRVAGVIAVDDANGNIPDWIEERIREATGGGKKSED